MQKSRAYEAILALGDGPFAARRPFDAPPNARSALVAIAHDIELDDPACGGRLIAGPIRSPALARVHIVEGRRELGLRGTNKVLGARERPFAPIAADDLGAERQQVNPLGSLPVVADVKLSAESADEQFVSRLVHDSGCRLSHGTWSR